MSDSDPGLDRLLEMAVDEGNVDVVQTLLNDHASLSPEMLDGLFSLPFYNHLPKKSAVFVSRFPLT